MGEAAKRVLLLSSTRQSWFVELSWAELLRERPYMIYAIFSNLREHFGWEVLRMDLHDAMRPYSFVRRVREFSPSVVYTYGALTSLHPLLYRPLTGCRYKVVHGWDDVYGDIWRHHYGRWAGRFMDWFERQIVTRSDAVVTLSRYNQNRARAWGRECRYIPNGCDEIHPDHSRCSIKLEGAMKLVYTGDQARWKRTEDICRAMRDVPRNIKLYLTGQPYSYLKKYASENCVFLGWLSKNDQWCVMDQADVLVCTADQDCNAKFHEYIRFKKPILGYDGRANLLFANGRNACLTRDYKTAIMKLYADRPFREKLSENMAKDIPVCSWREIAMFYERFFLGILT
jgi:hypothetical protein